MKIKDKMRATVILRACASEKWEAMTDASIASGRRLACGVRLDLLDLLKRGINGTASAARLMHADEGADVRFAVNGSELRSLNF
jgi:hypothetical protein